jgi:hypothetical protein
MTLNVIDNLFDATKAHILFNIVSQSQLRGFTFINNATPIDYNQSENSNFISNMRPIKQLPIISDLRWGP